MSEVSEDQKKLIANEKEVAEYNLKFIEKYKTMAQEYVRINNRKAPIKKDDTGRYVWLNRKTRRKFKIKI